MPNLLKVAVPAVSLLIAFLAYSSQILFLYIAPHPLTRDQTIKLNLLVACIWVSYYKACTTDPGNVPPDWMNSEPLPKRSGSHGMTGTDRLRWCRKCNLFKPPRTHHCKTCNK
ncbi:Zinc finger, DHHC-type, palmitoyltransferase [Ascosphaera apis ARSEF 7405]|uniref:Zinc finger, DHHC-type, palmitoyltransferase n=1 Tax=Ascosphaera apis ARSEF 7405 TaxID=392613 RepID=A0A167Z0X2_9EURO|nr:Zinc finger, DHHC-type, palmitoyltransferase [Ascosphaera apis ARSEF 7405]